MLDVEGTSKTTPQWFADFLDEERVVAVDELLRPGSVLSKLESAELFNRWALHTTLFQARIVAEQVRAFLGWTQS